VGGELAQLGGDRLQGGQGVGAEGVVGAGDRGDQGRLDHLAEPGQARARVPEDALKVRVHGGQVQQGLVDVEHLRAAHGDLLALPGPR
jgi:hypothetical protein